MFHKYEDDFQQFIEVLTQKKSIYSNMAALVMKADEKKYRLKTEVNEIVQAIQFEFMEHEVWLLLCSEKSRIFLLIKNAKTKALNLLETAIRNEFSEEDLKIELSVPVHKGIDKICSILADTIPSNDNRALFTLKRLARVTNTFLVHSSNDGVKDLAVKNLQCFGNVLASSTYDDFINNYRQYAPNVCFIYDQDYSSDLVKKIRGNLDPYCKIVVISKEASAAHVKALVQTGISGFLVFPVSFQTVSSQLTRLNVTNHQLVSRR